MWECWSNADFMSDVFLRCLPATVTYLCYSFLLNHARDWF